MRGGANVRTGVDDQRRAAVRLKGVLVLIEDVLADAAELFFIAIAEFVTGVGHQGCCGRRDLLQACRHACCLHMPDAIVYTIHDGRDSCGMVAAPSGTQATLDA